ncbi:hypothetical protein [Marinicauda salina]|uniref:hypothetical protein n=1 Tax=Marinicauda salina TaxID=2135793 RepID=UPI0011B26814|nr:hypothetical protein [Marinicauda salina]
MASPPTPRDERLERQYRRLGTRNPACVVCGESDPFCLELHHIGEQKHNDELAIVCRNCHRKVTDPQKDRAHVECDDPEREQLGRLLCGLSDLFAMIGDSLGAWGRKLLSLDDANTPERGS